MPAIITDSFDYDDIVRVLDLDEAFVHHQIDALQPKYWRIVIKTKPCASAEVLAHCDKDETQGAEDFRACDIEEPSPMIAPNIAITN